MRLDSGLKIIQIHMEQLWQLKIIRFHRHTGIDRQIPRHRRSVSGTDILTAVASEHPEPHGFSKFHGCYFRCKIGQKGDAPVGIQPVGSFYRPCRAGGNTCVSAPIRASDFDSGIIRNKLLINNNGNQYDPGALCRYLI